MSIFQNLFKVKGFDTIIGSAESDGSNLTKILIGMMSSMGMSNPASLPSKSSKGVKITKKGKNSYKITLGMFTPPIDIMWTGTLNESELMDLISKVINDNKTISYVNYHNVTGNKIFQFAISY